MTAADRAALAERGASIIHQGFEAYHRDFLEVTRRAKGRFERQDWPGALADARERLAGIPGARVRLAEPTGSGTGAPAHRSVVVTVPGGHTVLWDAPSETARAIADFVA